MNLIKHNVYLKENSNTEYLVRLLLVFISAATKIPATQ